MGWKQLSLFAVEFACVASAVPIRQEYQEYQEYRAVCTYASETECESCGDRSEAPPLKASEQIFDFWLGFIVRQYPIILASTLLAAVPAVYLVVISPSYTASATMI